MVTSIHSEHRVSNSFHLTRFCARALTSAQVFTRVLASFSIVRVHVVFGRPLIRFSCGFQSRASLATSPAGFLRVWLIQLHYNYIFNLVLILLLEKSDWKITKSPNIPFLCLQNTFEVQQEFQNISKLF